MLPLSGELHIFDYMNGAIFKGTPFDV